ncbi:putative AsnC-family transcriptional regulator [Streptomyces himastatinicus ATCC 53653]|uniref:Putative AsnC-family transcriptional regulator n=1 Tax=Streptomyces himastatinicus ATCC 53653 TaxID=457427 RepID=D9W8G3_9ACTN|nr:Lrp/AsnC family transcriptional regulator [Streptomyces himastatinicus]EFL22670.1 putative AsnC-family transcriptional regulator [Streptomyces himastatinicus ATCC 53653]
MDDLERRLLHALKIDGRVSFSRLAKVLGVSDQTVARRYRKLQTEVSLRVIARSDARLLGTYEWFVRMKGGSVAVSRTASLLAQRPETSWVSLVSGGLEVVCLVRSTDARGEQQALLRHLGEPPQAGQVAAYDVLHTFLGERRLWPGLKSDLDDEQIKQLTAGLPEPVGAEDLRITDSDKALIEALGEDGRTPLQELALVTDSAENTVRRRLEHLRACGALYFDLDVDYHLLGFDALALLWLAVRPQCLVPVAEAVARHPEVSFVAATTGGANLLASVICRDNSHLFDYLAHQVGEMEGVLYVEVAPILHIVKRVVAPAGVTV